MEKTAIGLIAALGAAIPLAGAHAAVAPQDAQRIMHAQSVAELLDPIPNPLGVMQATEADRAAEAEEAQKAPQRLAQFYFHDHHHHHHWYHHHHWHHHHWHHHHHHHHWWYHHHHHYYY